MTSARPRLAGHPAARGIGHSRTRVHCSTAKVFPRPSRRERDPGRLTSHGRRTDFHCLVQQDAGQPGPSTTSHSPAGASTAPSCTIAWRPSFAKCSGVFSSGRIRTSRVRPTECRLRDSAVLARERRNVQPRHRCMSNSAAVAGCASTCSPIQKLTALEDSRIVGARPLSDAITQCVRSAEPRVASIGTDSAATLPVKRLLEPSRPKDAGRVLPPLNLSDSIANTRSGALPRNRYARDTPV